LAARADAQVTAQLDGPRQSVESGGRFWFVAPGVTESALLLQLVAGAERKSMIGRFNRGRGRCFVNAEASDRLGPRRRVPRRESPSRVGRVVGFVRLQQRAAALGRRTHDCFTRSALAFPSSRGATRCLQMPGVPANARLLHPAQSAAYRPPKTCALSARSRALASRGWDARGTKKGGL
jgi:hypothetical protein